MSQTLSTKGNPCEQCQYGWRETDGHCYMWREEPERCHHFRIDWYKATHIPADDDGHNGVG